MQFVHLSAIDLMKQNYLILAISSERRHPVLSTSPEAITHLTVPPVEARCTRCDSLAFHAVGWIPLLHVQGVHGDRLHTVSNGFLSCFTLQQSLEHTDADVEGQCINSWLGQQDSLQT